MADPTLVELEAIEAAERPVIIAGTNVWLDRGEDAGAAVVFTGLTLAIGVSTWVFSNLKFQADMGLLLIRLQDLTRVHLGIEAVARHQALVIS